MASSSNYLLVVAIDFGTTYSGYAFSFTAEPDNIKMNSNWGSAVGFQSYKTPTSVLLNKDGEFVAFGYTAEEEYEDDNQDMHLFRHFKMMLYDQNIAKSCYITSTRGKKFKAVDVFAHALRYLKDHLINSINSHSNNALESDDIRWVITVPAIWRDEAKQFMREAAHKAGLIAHQSSKQLLLALEPEVASLLGRKSEALKPGTRYILLDCGGGTNDMAIHEVIDEDRVKEIQLAEGGPWGGNVVNMKFIDILENIFEKGNIERYKGKDMSNFIKLMHQFEQSKRKIQANSNAKMKLTLPWEFQSFCSETELAEHLKNCSASVNSGVLMLPQEVVRSLFKVAIDHILQGVRDIVDNRTDIELIMMAGGFSESLWLQDAVRHEFEPRGCRVLVLKEAEQAVLKGAVMLGHSHFRVVSRKARKTYGVSCFQRFDERKHDPQRKYINENNVEMCRGVFEPFIEVGDDISTDSVINRTGSLTKNMSEFHLSLFSLDRKPKTPVEYYDNPDVVMVGNIDIPTPNPKGLTNRLIDLNFSFGGTEICVDVYDRTTNKTTSTTIDFLSK